MNRDFSILIIDDDTDYSDGVEEQLEDYLRENQLVPRITCKTKFNQKECDTIGNKYDLIIVDYNLPNNTYGTSFISKIRSISLLPDIIFYSSKSSIDVISENEENDNREPLMNLLQKGIYFSNSEKMVDIAKQVISKIILREEKTNGFKGLVLSSVSEYESLVNAINDSLVKRIPKEKVDSFAFYCQDILKEMMKNSEKHLCDFSTTFDLVKLLNDENRWMDHYKRTRIMNHLLKELGFKYIDYDEYVATVLNLRNSLGHVFCEQEDGEEFYSFVCNGKTMKLTPEYCKEKRKMLLEWKTLFDSILDDVSNDIHNQTE